jgi:hypothetical protein
MLFENVEHIVKFITNEQLSYVQYEIQDLLDKLDINEADLVWLLH